VKVRDVIVLKEVANEGNLPDIVWFVDGMLSVSGGVGATLWRIGDFGDKSSTCQMSH